MTNNKQNMVKYISVLNSDMSKSYWKAIQWDNSLSSIELNSYYTAGVNLNIPKHADDQAVKTKTVRDVLTSSEGMATIIDINNETTNLLKLANNKASKSFLKNIES